MSGAIVVGTSGFAYADWKPLFYPDGLAQAKFLALYASRLGGVEINYTFNRFPTPKLLEGWAGKVPDSFVFSLKTPKLITHQKKLRECETLFHDFAKTASLLGGRTGPLLLQLPPSMPADPGLLRDILAQAPGPARVACEFRDPSWDTDAVRAVLADAGAAWVIAESGASPPAMHVTAPAFTYLRLRRDAYDDAAANAWIDRIAGLAAGGTAVFCYLRHDADGSNALVAERMIAALEDRAGKQGP